MRSSRVEQTFLRKVLYLSLAILVAGITAFAQAGRGRLSGLVTDASGGDIPDAAVTLLNTATGIVQSTVTTGAGLYSFLSLAPGSYTLTVKKSGFETAVQTTVLVEVDRTTAVNVTLRPGTVLQSVTVKASAPLTDTTNSTIGQLISAQTIQRVPLVDRDVYKLVQLSAGITPVNGAVNNVEFNARPGADVSGYTINGQSQGTLTYLLDGSPLTIAENNLAATIPALIPALDSIQEYRVETNNVPAAYQSAGAGVVSLVSKSGTNKFHGDLFGYDRPNAFSANDPFVKANQIESGQPNTPPAFHRYQWGGSIGGPIRRDKLFFFADYEGTQQRSLDNATETVPTMAERTGNFSADTFTVYNPFNVVNGARQPFAGNVISPQYLDPVALAMAQHYPAPNRAGEGAFHLNNYFNSGLDPDNEQKFDARIDDSLSGKQRLFGRFTFARLFFGNANHFNNMWDPNHYQNISNERNFLLADDYSLSPTSMLELRYSFTRHYENQTSDPRATGFNITSLGFPQSLAAQQVYHDIPYIYFSGPTSNIGSPAWTTFRFATQDHDFITALNVIKSRHDLKMGFEFEKQFMNVGQPVGPSGFYLFDNTATSSSTWAGDGSDFASFMMGMGSPSEWQPAFTKDIFAADSNPYYGLYIQDDYHVSTKLTLNIGLRWDIYGGRNERHNRLEWFDPNLQYTVNGVALRGGERFVGPHQSPFATNLTDFGPRFGLAYQPVKNLVVRGGFGMFYGPSSHMVASAEINSDSFYTQTTWSAVSTDAYGNSILLNPLHNPFPNGVLQPTNGLLGPTTNLGNTLSTVYRSQPDPAAYNYNFGLEYQLPRGFVASAAWVGSRGLHQIAGADLNQLSLQQIGRYQSALGKQVPNPFEAAITNPTAPFYGAATIPQWLAISSYPQFSSGSPNAGVGIGAAPIGDSDYNSLQTKVEKRLTAHFTTIASFTWGKLLADTEGNLSFIGQHGSAQDWRNLNLERSLSSQDVSRWFSWQASYDLPVGRGRLLNTSGRVDNFLIGGWTLNSVLSLSTGVPIIITGATNDPWFSQRPDQVCNAANGAPHTAAEWFLPNCFAMPASPFAPGTAPRTLSNVRSDGTHNLDLSLFKDFRFGESKDLQFQFAAFNVGNWVQLGIPNSFWNPQDLSTFGQITYAASQPRQLQFGLRFIF